MNQTKAVGKLFPQIEHLIGITPARDRTIYLGESNIAHMKTRHPQDYTKYASFIPLILSAPDYVGRNPSDGSIEYVKEFQVDQTYVKVAVRISQQDRYYVRSLYCLNEKRTRNFIKKGTLKPVNA